MGGLKRRVPIVLALVAGLLWGALAVAQDKPRMAVLKFVAKAEAEEEADAVAEEVRAAFVKSQRYVVVDRTMTDKIFEEWALQQSGATEADNAVRVGKLFAVKSLVTGKLSRFSSGGWQLSAVRLNAESGVTEAAETTRFPGDFFTLLNEKVPDLARTLANSGGVQPAPLTSAPASPAKPPREPETVRVVIFPPSFKSTRSEKRNREIGDARIFAGLRAGLERVKIVKRLPASKELAESVWSGRFVPTLNEEFVISKSRELKADVAVVYRAGFGQHNRISEINLIDVASGKRFSREELFFEGQWGRVLNDQTVKLAEEYRKATPAR
jgi:TolB-like protein